MFRNTIAKLYGYCQGLIQFYWHSAAVEIHHRHYIINYVHGFQTYKILAPRRRGPCQFDRVVDQDGNDVTAAVKQFAGPSHNFHGIPTTPEMIGYRSLAFFNGIDDSSKTFEAKEVMDI